MTVVNSLPGAPRKAADDDRDDVISPAAAPRNPWGNPGDRRG
jgi:hypothetical protein